MHRAWFGHDSPPLPLTVVKIKAVGAMFKAGHYASFANYASRPKAEHIEKFMEHGAAWSEELATEIRNATRSVARGCGPSKQSFPLDMAKVFRLGVLDSPVVENGPIGPTDFVTLGIFFMAREMELSCAAFAHLFVDIREAEVTWSLPVSKNDPRAVGTTRTWGCVCGSSLLTPCPYHAALRQVDRVRRLSMDLGVAIESLPLFPNESGTEVSKEVAVDTIRCCISKCGLPVLDDQSRPVYGGHSLRTGGAVAMASMGVDATRIQVRPSQVNN